MNKVTNTKRTNFTQFYLVEKSVIAVYMTVWTKSGNQKLIHKFTL